MSERFVKSADTRVPVGRSRDELERVLRRYGATAFASASDYEAGTVSVSFKVPNAPGESSTVPVRLEAGFLLIYARLFGEPRGHKYDADRLAQAERVAWRHLVLWVDAACTAVGAGLQTMREAFFAHTVVRNAATGRIERMAEAVAQIASEGRLMLPSGDGDG